MAQIVTLDRARRVIKSDRTLLVASAILLLAVSSAARASPSVSEAMQSVQYLVGTWNCAHTVGDFSGTYVMSFAKDLGDRWLKQTWDFPATATDPEIHSEYFLGYDPRLPGWIHFGAPHQRSVLCDENDEPGQRTLVVAVRASWHQWQCDMDQEVGRRVRDRRPPEYPQDGKLVTEHHLCKKLQ